MLSKLTISNVALIEHLVLEFDKGFHVLTGETGAGKSIFIDALSFVLGDRVNKTLIKSGKTKATVEAIFTHAFTPPVLAALEDLDIIPESNDDDLILYREISTSGKNICRLNGIVVPVATLKAIGNILVDIHGQHEHQSLLEVKQHGIILDAYAGQQALFVKKEILECCNAFQNAQKELLSGFMNEQERARNISLLEFQLKEINDANLQPKEDAELIAQRNILSNAQHVMHALQESYQYISGNENNALSLINAAAQELDSIAPLSPDYQQAYQKIQELYYSLEDSAFILRDLKNNFEYDPALLQSIEERLDLIQTLKRKYGSSISEILSYRDSIQEQLSLLENSVERCNELKNICDREQERYHKLAEKLYSFRKEAAVRLQTEITSHFADLGLQKAQFMVSFQSRSTDIPHPEGTEKAEFMFSANAGQNPMQLKQIASGGEMSRIMLALKTILANTDQVPTLIFDEIDTGVSGRIATAIGEKMKHIASSHQVLCITHLPQIVAYADIHFLVEKNVYQDQTVSTVKQLNDQEHIQEIANLMGSTDHMQHGIALAKELILQANKLDKS